MTSTNPNTALPKHQQDALDFIRAEMRRWAYSSPGMTHNTAGWRKAVTKATKKARRAGFPVDGLILH